MSPPRHALVGVRRVLAPWGFLLFLGLCPCPSPLAAQIDPAAETLSILGSPEFVTSPTTGWRITWRSVAGRQYRLEANEELSNAAGWTGVVTLTATGDTTQFIDPAPLDVVRRFWRVLLLPATADTEPPTLGAVQAFVKLVGEDLMLELRVAAADNVGVVGVVFLGRPEAVPGLATLGDGALDAGDDLWKLVVAPPGDPAERRLFAARARDAAGNETLSGETGFSFATAAEFAAIGSDGSPQPGALVTTDGAGNLGPFGLRAGGGGGAGTAADLLLLFPGGASSRSKAGGSWSSSRARSDSARAGRCGCACRWPGAAPHSEDSRSTPIPTRCCCPSRA